MAASGGVPLVFQSQLGAVVCQIPDQTGVAFTRGPIERGLAGLSASRTSRPASVEPIRRLPSGGRPLFPTRSPTARSRDGTAICWPKWPSKPAPDRTVVPIQVGGEICRIGFGGRPRKASRPALQDLPRTRYGDSGVKLEDRCDLRVVGSQAGQGEREPSQGEAGKPVALRSRCRRFDAAVTVYALYPYSGLA